MVQVGQVLIGATFNEPMRVVTVRSEGDGAWTLGLVGEQTQRFVAATLTSQDIGNVGILQASPSYAGDGALLRQGLQAYQLGVAYEFDPFFGLSISRVDPLPHQLEAIYDYLLKLPRVRFLLADEAGAGKTIMAGLLIRELKLRGLAQRIMIVVPANLSFQWQRELRDKFDTIKKPSPQMMLKFMALPAGRHGEQQAAAVPEIRGRGRKKAGVAAGGKAPEPSAEALRTKRDPPAGRAGATTLDRVHAAMLL